MKTIKSLKRKLGIKIADTAQYVKDHSYLFSATATNIALMTATDNPSMILAGVTGSIWESFILALSISDGYPHVDHLHDVPLEFGFVRDPSMRKSKYITTAIMQGLGAFCGIGVGGTVQNIAERCAQ